MLPLHVQERIDNGGLWLDLGCGTHVDPRTTGMDKRKLDTVDIVHDLEDIPYPLPSECCYRILASHVFEHLNPALMIDIMDELWRIMQPHGQLMIAMPYPGTPRYWQDPTHRHAWNEATAQYFDPACSLYQVYTPRPWHIDENAWHSVGDINIILSKVTNEGNGDSPA